MRLDNLFLLSVLLLLGSCGSFKEGLLQSGGDREAIKNAILDFSNASGLYQKDTVFSVWGHDELHRMVLKETDARNSEWVEGPLYEGIAAVSISANYDKMLITDNVRIGTKGVKIPTRYIEKEGKLFYWWDDDYPLTQETLDTFRKYNLLQDDEGGTIKVPDFTINDAQKAAHYYFCKNDLRKYKRVATSKGLGYYPPPKLNCN